MIESPIIISADWIFTNIGKPIKRGSIKIDNSGKILNIYSTEETKNQKIDYLYSGFLVPGFINAHCHLELSFAVARIERDKGINEFINRVEILKKETAEEQKKSAIEMAMEILEEEGIMAVGDICNTDLTLESKTNHKDILFRNFIEVYGLDPQFAEEKMMFARQLKSKFENSSIVPHATYSLSKELFDLIESEISITDIISIHNQESEAESQYFNTGDGEMADRFRNWNLPKPNFIPSGRSPMSTLAEFFRIENNSIILIHNTFSTKYDIEEIALKYPNSWFCFCPSSNLFIENQLPKIGNFSEVEDKICLGTDSLASNDTLSILHEMKLIAKENPELKIENLIKWATINGAKALGFDDQLGSFEEGKRPGINLIEEVDSENLKLTDFSFINPLKYMKTK